MSTIYEVVADIRATLQNQAARTQQQLVGLADRYAEACVRVNEQLATCTHFLHSGFRSEAIRLCELEPKLLDGVAQLDFPERQHWEQYCQQAGLTTPPVLMLDAAVELNSAYAVEEQLAALTGQLRRLCLARAPVAERVSVLRRIIQQDPHTVVWHENLRALGATATPH